MLDPVERAPSSHRRYTEDEIRWVTLLTRLRSTGMPIRRIREYADLVRAGEGNEAERLALLEAHRDAVLEQLERDAQQPRGGRLQDRRSTGPAQGARLTRCPTIATDVAGRARRALTSRALEDLRWASVLPRIPPPPPTKEQPPCIPSRSAAKA